MNTLEKIKEILRNEVKGYPNFGSLKMFFIQSLGWITKEEFLNYLQENNYQLNEKFTIAGVDKNKKGYFIMNHRVRIKDVRLFKMKEIEINIDKYEEVF